MVRELILFVLLYCCTGLTAYAAEPAGTLASERSSANQSDELTIAQTQTAYTLEINQGHGVLRAPDGSVLISGILEQDGSAGMSYILTAPEGYVCGRFSLSRWDPNNEGQSLVNQISVQWLPPEGSVISNCGAVYAEANGIYSGNTNSFQGTFSKIEQPVTDSYVLKLKAGQGTLIAPDGSVLISGILEQDGSAGMSYILTAPEGYVCGRFSLSRWDPNNEGQSLVNQISVQWLPPEGSVISNCGAVYAEANGIYSGNRNRFRGKFTKD